MRERSRLLLESDLSTVRAACTCPVETTELRFVTAAPVSPSLSPPPSPLSPSLLQPPPLLSPTSPTPSQARAIGGTHSALTVCHCARVIAGTTVASQTGGLRAAAAARPGP